ncbi:endoglucanase [Trichophyton equinum CBS 127.97]|uniref:Endoglucanase n=1 Tax=Trichophyton equinum (strain ATCC MYA-4606 / CBS 127.97) TaxID=559882 RepID=F2PN68_TRIEC|nr:endoglucanase [Trichophyton equinum CBS 127.97]
MQLIYVLLAVCTGVSGHMEMKTPYPFRSKFNPENKYTDIDYSMTSPLNSDGSNFPCKGYHSNTTFRATANYTAGQIYSLELTGTATHGGGSCQVSLSLDNGTSFRVIKSIMGGCPLTDTYNFTIPRDTPSGRAMLAWTWFNLFGNREMYMNCAPVMINNCASDASRTLNVELPKLFEANIGNGCMTIEGRETVFANPGCDVIYGGNVTADNPPMPKCE